MAIRSEVEHWDVVIVGAGIAGLAAVCSSTLLNFLGFIIDRESGNRSPQRWPKHPGARKVEHEQGSRCTDLITTQRLQDCRWLEYATISRREETHGR